MLLHDKTSSALRPNDVCSFSDYYSLPACLLLLISHFHLLVVFLYSSLRPSSLLLPLLLLSSFSERYTVLSAALALLGQGGMLRDRCSDRPIRPDKAGHALRLTSRRRVS